MSASMELNQIEKHKVKKMIQTLEKARGSGTSMVTLIIKAGSQLPMYTKMLTEEYGTASNIKSRVNRLSVLAAITSAQYQLKQYRLLPKNGLAVFCGLCVDEEGKEKKLNISFEPPLPLTTGTYTCDSRFHTEALHGLLECHDRYGFLVVNGQEALYGAISGDQREVLTRFTVDLPKKHNKGGQSALRFARLRDEAITNYIRKICETANRTFLEGEKVNIKGLIIAGSADLKNQVAKSALLDGRIKASIANIIDVSYGGDNGFTQAIEASQDLMKGFRLMEEMMVLKGFFNEIARDTGRYCFGAKDTMYALEMGAVETLIVWDEIPLRRLVYRTLEGEEKVTYAKDLKGVECTEIMEDESFDDWIADHYKDFGTTLEFVTDKTSEGSQFTKGFGGLGGIMRWEVKFEDYELADEMGGGDDGSVASDGFDDWF